MKGIIAKARGLLVEANRLALWLTVTALGFYALIVFLTSATNSTILDGWIGVLLVFTLPLLGLAPATLLHELGHAIAAHLCGWRVWIICVGPVVVRFSPHISVHARASLGGDAGGFVLPSPRSVKMATPLRSILITAGGPFASVAGAAVAFSIAQPELYTNGWAGLGSGVLYAFGVSSVACAVLTLWPHTGRDGVGNDILQIVANLRRAQSHEDRAFVHALGVVEYGFSPAEWDASLRRELQREKLAASPSAFAPLAAFLHAIAEDDYVAAVEIAETPLPTDKRPSVQHYLRAWLAACEHGDFATAESALALSRGSIVQTAWIMQLREIALIGILAAHGDAAWAKRKYNRLRDQLQAPSPTNAIMTKVVDRAMRGPVGVLLSVEITERT